MYPANLATFSRGGERYAREGGTQDEVLDQLAKLGAERKLSDLPAVMRAIGEAGDQGKASGSGVPIEGYDDLTVDEATERLDGLSKETLRALRVYQREHKDRKTMLEEIDRRVDD